MLMLKVKYFYKHIILSILYKLINSFGFFIFRFFISIFFASRALGLLEQNEDQKFS